jgi:hypothetical protein
MPVKSRGPASHPNQDDVYTPWDTISEITP